MKKEDFESYKKRRLWVLLKKEDFESYKGKDFESY